MHTELRTFRDMDRGYITDVTHCGLAWGCSVLLYLFNNRPYLVDPTTLSPAVSGTFTPVEELRPKEGKR